jgi:hypothetical protein
MAPKKFHRSFDFLQHDDQVPVTNAQQTFNSARRPSMSIRTYRTPMRLWLLLVVTLCFVIIPGSAQTTKAPQTPAQKSSQPSTQSKNAKLTPPPGKMRGTTNEMRMAAAIRTADRQAQAQKKAANSGVKQ